jgi:hypothetical protein
MLEPVPEAHNFVTGLPQAGRKPPEARSDWHAKRDLVGDDLRRSRR